MTASTPVPSTSAARSAIARLLIAGVAAAAALALSGCGAGQISQTADEVPAINGIHAQAGQIALRDLRIEYPTDEASNPSGITEATLAGTLVNDSATVTDKLRAIHTDLATVHIQPAQGDTLEIVPGQRVLFGPPSEVSGSGQHPAPTTAQVRLTDLKRHLIPGLTYAMDFDFAENGHVTVQVPIHANPAAAHTPTTAPAGH